MEKEKAFKEVSVREREGGREGRREGGREGEKEERREG